LLRKALIRAAKPSHTAGTLKLSKNPPLRISAAEKAPVYAGFGNEIFKNGGFSTASLKLSKNPIYSIIIS
jgi:hypothetical protein